eukprot:1144703-Pelagomonas_calceolata.AAC.8
MQNDAYPMGLHLVCVAHAVRRAYEVQRSHQTGTSALTWICTAMHTRRPNARRHCAMQGVPAHILGSCFTPSPIICPQKELQGACHDLKKKKEISSDGPAELEVLQQCRIQLHPHWLHSTRQGQQL